MTKIKLYTEEQVNELRRALRDIAQWDEDLEEDWEDAGNRAMDALRCFEKITPIELPSDEEIYNKCSDWVFRENPTKWSVNDDTAGDNMNSFAHGAKWMRNKIQSKI